MSLGDISSGGSTEGFLMSHQSAASLLGLATQLSNRNTITTACESGIRDCEACSDD